MMKNEFEQLAGCSVSSEDYSKIEKCYTHFGSLFSTESDVVLFYQTFGMDGIVRLFCEIAGFDKAMSFIREEARLEHDKYLDLSFNYDRLHSHVLGLLRGLVVFLNAKLDDPLFSSFYSNPDNSKAFFLALINYLDKEIEQFGSEVK